MGEKDLAPSLIQSITDSSLYRITPDLAEVALDHILDDGIIKDIPVVRSVVALYETIVSVRDMLLIKKLLLFLLSLSSVSPEKKTKFKEKINSDEKFKRVVGEKLIVILDRLDDMEKPALVARAFQAYVEEHIDLETFQRLTSAIDRSFLLDMRTLKTVGDPKKFTSHTTLNLSNSGLLEVNASSTVRIGAKSNEYHITELGNLLLEFVLKD